MKSVKKISRRESNFLDERNFCVRENKNAAAPFEQRHRKGESRLFLFGDLDFYFGGDVAEDFDFYGEVAEGF